jgi:hypothetical protein
LDGHVSLGFASPSAATTILMTITISFFYPHAHASHGHIVICHHDLRLFFIKLTHSSSFEAVELEITQGHTHNQLHPN